MLTREDAYRAVENAADASALFGPYAPERADEAKRRYHELLAVLHPDKNGGDPRAHAAAAKLIDLHGKWAKPLVVKTATASYALGARHAVGSVSSVYRTDGPHLVKVVRNPALNPLLHAEWAALRTLERYTDAHRWLRPFYPRLLDTSGPVAKGERAFTVLDPLVDGFVTLAEVQRAYPDGLDGRDYAWMHRRLLKAVAGAHMAGLVHGHITADDVLVHPEQHGIVLVGWTFAVERGQEPLATDKAAHYPPEVHKGLPLTSGTDVYMLHKLMLTTLRADEDRQRTFATWCTQESPGQRPEAVDLLKEYDDLLEELYGPRTFRPFALPEIGA